MYRCLYNLRVCPPYNNTISGRVGGGGERTELKGKIIKLQTVIKNSNNSNKEK